MAPQASVRPSEAVLRVQLALSFDEDAGNGALTNYELDRPHAKRASTGSSCAERSTPLSGGSPRVSRSSCAQASLREKIAPRSLPL